MRVRTEFSHTHTHTRAARPIPPISGFIPPLFSEQKKLPYVWNVIICFTAAIVVQTLRYRSEDPRGVVSCRKRTCEKKPIKGIGIMISTGKTIKRCEHRLRFTKNAN